MLHGRPDRAAQADHHLRPQRYGGKSHPENLIPLCRPCHDVVDCTHHVTADHLKRMDMFPRLNSLLMARLLADVYDATTEKRIEESVLEQAVKVLQNPHEIERLAKLKGALHQLKTRRKQRLENSYYREWQKENEATPESSRPLRGGI